MPPEAPKSPDMHSGLKLLVSYSSSSTVEEETPASSPRSGPQSPHTLPRFCYPPYTQADPQSPTPSHASSYHKASADGDSSASSLNLQLHPGFNLLNFNEELYFSNGDEYPHRIFASDEPRILVDDSDDEPRILVDDSDEQPHAALNTPRDDDSQYSPYNGSQMDSQAEETGAYDPDRRPNKRAHDSSESSDHKSH